MKKTQRNSYWCCRLAALVLVLLTGSSSQSADWRSLTPLPGEITIDMPSRDVPPKVAKLSGVWQGQWQFSGSSGLSTTIIIERIDRKGVSAIYSWNGYSWNSSETMKPGWLRVRGSVEGDLIVLKWGTPPQTFTVTLELTDDKTAHAEYFYTSYQAKARLDRKD